MSWQNNMHRARGGHSGSVASGVGTYMKNLGSRDGHGGGRQGGPNMQNSEQMQMLQNKMVRQQRFNVKSGDENKQNNGPANQDNGIGPNKVQLSPKTPMNSKQDNKVPDVKIPLPSNAPMKQEPITPKSTPQTNNKARDANNASPIKAPAAPVKTPLMKDPIEAPKNMDNKTWQQGQQGQNDWRKNQYQQGPNQNHPGMGNDQYRQGQNNPNQNRSSNQYQQNRGGNNPDQNQNSYQQNQYQRGSNMDQTDVKPPQAQQNSSQRGSYGSGQQHQGQGDWRRNVGDSGSNNRQNQNNYNRSREGSFNRGGAGQGQYPYAKGGRGGYGGADRIREKLESTITGPLINLDPYDITEKKFNSYAKVFVGNIPKGVESEEVLTLFKDIGEIGPVYFSKEASFGFITFDYKANAAKAIKIVDNKIIRNRPIKVRFATINEGIRVRNLSHFVTNELLEKAFSVFGPVENCHVVVDDRGTPKGEGIIIFKEKRFAQISIKKCQEECFFLSGALRPVIITALEPLDDHTDGFGEEQLPKDEEYHHEREVLPHFADVNSFEQEFGASWIKLFNMYDEKKAILDRDFKIEIERLEKKMVLAKVEYETDKLRKELAQREAETEQLRRHFGGDEMSARGGYGATGYGDQMDMGYDTGYGAVAGAGYDQSYGDAYEATEYNSGGYIKQEPASGYSASQGGYERNAGGYSAAAGGKESFERGSYENDLKRSLPAPSSYDQRAGGGYEASPTAVAPPKDGGGAPSKRPRY